MFRSQEEASRLLKESGIKLLDQVPADVRTEESLAELLQERNLSFLAPLLSIKVKIRAVSRIK